MTLAPGKTVHPLPPFPINLFGLAVILIIATASTVSMAEDKPTSSPVAAYQLAQISGDPRAPRRHFRAPSVAKLTPEGAAKVYAGIVKNLAKGYAASGNDIARAYRAWKRYNTYPYKSSSHGRRFLSNYANEAAASYGKYERAGRLPAGSVIAKDSFTMDAKGKVTPGPLFLMEKMPAGFNYVSGDWRYSMIMPDGTLFGETKGTNSKAVKFCIPCHLATEKTDHLYFIPKKFRVK